MVTPSTGVAGAQNNELDIEKETAARLRQIRERHDVMMTFWSNIHSEGLEDDRFRAGEQWPDHIVNERKDAGRPMLTYNLMPSFTRQILNKVRQNRPQVRVLPVETNRGQTPDVQNIQGTNDYSMADVYMGTIRNIEHVSRAALAYDTALQHAVEHGFGYWRVRNRDSEHDPWQQELIIERIKNSYTVLLDPDADELDYSDAQDAIIFVDMHKDAFAKAHPEAQPEDFAQGSVGQTYDGWYNNENIRVAEYYYVDHVDDHVIMMSNGKIHYLSDVEDVLDEIKETTGVHIMVGDDGERMQKKVRRRKVMWMKMTANQILEEPIELPFEHIPICPVLGDEVIVDGQTRYESAIRHAKDAQTSYNYWRTASAETVALAPRAPWILTAEQIKGHTNLYEEANKTNAPYLLYNHVDGQPPPQRNYPGENPAAEMAAATQDGADMQTIIGLHDANLGKEGNEKSGKAILARQNQGSTSTYNFPDNLARAMQHMGRLLVTAIPRIYTQQRQMRIRLPDDTEDFVEINKLIRDEESGKMVLTNDIAYGKYDAVVDTGPSYATQRQEAAELQLELLKVLPPDVVSTIVHLVVKNMALPGTDEISRILRKLLPDNLKSEDERAADLPKGVIFDEQGNEVYEETGEPYQPPPTPEQQIAERQAAVEDAKAQAEIAKSDADKQMAEAKLVEAQAKLAEAQKAGSVEGGEGFDIESALPEIKRIVEEAASDHEVDEGAHKDVIEAAVTDAVADALKRVKAFVDREKADFAATVASSQPVPATADKPAATPKKAEKAEKAEPVIVNLPIPTKKVTFRRDKDGRIKSAEIIKISETKPKNDKGVTIAPSPKREIVDFERENGEITGATIAPKGA